MTRRPRARRNGAALAWLAVAIACLSGCAGTAPALGVDAAGRFVPCKASPNCVSSDASDQRHAIAPLTLSTAPDEAWQTLVAHLQAQPGVTIEHSDDRYLRAAARTRVLRFVDDVEFHLRPQAGQIAMRSASRVGYSDLGTNRRRLERVRAALIDAGVVAAPTGSNPAN